MAWCGANDMPRVELPANDASDDVHRRFVGWLLQTMIEVEVDAVFTSEAYGDGFVEILNQMQAGRTPIVHIEIDRARARVPASGTLIRGDVHANRHLLHPLVYSDFVDRVAILGGESTGKTTLARALANRLATSWVPEYGRELWEAQGGRLGFSDMLKIAREQVKREESAAMTAARFVVCDTTPLTTFLYSEAMFGKVDPRLVELVDRHYDFVFLCEPDFGFVQDGTRRDKAFQSDQQRWYLRELSKRGMAFQTLCGSVDARVERVLSSIGQGDHTRGKSLLEVP
ncbi:MAG: AAA family ATPase, partial [bacterium]